MRSGTRRRSIMWRRKRREQRQTGGGRLFVCRFPVVGRIDPVEYVGVSQQRNGDVRNINHPLCGCATLVIQKITFPL